MTIDSWFYTSILMVPVLLCSTIINCNADGLSLSQNLIPTPHSVTQNEGAFELTSNSLELQVSAGVEHAACREILAEAFNAAGVKTQIKTDTQRSFFQTGSGAQLPQIPEKGGDEAYVLAINPNGISAQARGAAGLLYAAQTLRQLLRCYQDAGAIPAQVITDYPAMRYRGVYIEGGQERFGRIVEVDYLIEQIKRLAELKMNTLMIECYNLFPFESFPACKDGASLKTEDVQRIVEAARYYHVILIPSLQTLAQASELVWNSKEGEPFREVTAGGLTCPSNPNLYPFIKGLFRDLLQIFGETPVLGVGCSEIEMQWQERYCPKCKARIDAGETVRDLLLGHADKCIKLVNELAQEMNLPVRPMIWGDEFYMYGPGHDWVGIEKIPTGTVMGFWKYWRDYDGIEGLMSRGYDVFGISAMYNNCFYLADLSPHDPPKSWPSIEQTGTLNISEMAQAALAAVAKYPEREMLGIATASFSKHRLRAFDSIWYGFALNGESCWSATQEPFEKWQNKFTSAFMQHWYGVSDKDAVKKLSAIMRQLDDCKSKLELANQTLHDVVGVVDTQEAGYIGNSILGAAKTCTDLIEADGRLTPELEKIRQQASHVLEISQAAFDELEALASFTDNKETFNDLLLAARKIIAHAEREIFLIESQQVLKQAGTMVSDNLKQDFKLQAERWSLHRQRTEEILKDTKYLYTQGDPCGLAQTLADVTAIERHFEQIGKTVGETPGKTIIEENFTKIDQAKWMVLGVPQLVDEALETSAPGGWEKRCGIAIREPLQLKNANPVVVEFDITPHEMGIDSQLATSCDASGTDTYRFAFYGPRDRFGLYTRSETTLKGPWVDPAAGWRLRAQSPTIEVDKTYHVRLEITQNSFRAIVHPAGSDTFYLPLWDTGEVPMDNILASHIMFVDVEPVDGKASTRWDNIKIRE